MYRHEATRRSLQQRHWPGRPNLHLWCPHSKGEVHDFERKGILTASAFESVISSKDAITAGEFLKILVHLRIIAEFTKPEDQEKRYFIPCVLNHVSESTGEDLKTDITPLVVKFKCKHCPKGLFGVLVTHLMTPDAGEKEGSDISFTLRDNKIFKDQVSFYVKSSFQKDEISCANSILCTLKSTSIPKSLCWS